MSGVLLYRTVLYNGMGSPYYLYENSYCILYEYSYEYLPVLTYCTLPYRTFAYADAMRAHMIADRLRVRIIDRNKPPCFGLIAI